MVAPKKRKATRRGTRGAPGNRPDPRAAASQVSADADGGIRQGDWLVIVSPVALADGRRLVWQSPQPVAFNLLEAKRHRDPGVRQRRQIMGNLVTRADGGVEPQNARAAIDCLAKLATAVLFSFTAVESIANYAIESLPDGQIVTLAKDRRVPKEKLVASLGIDEKFKRVVPLAEGGKSIAGTSAWKRYRELKFLRDELVHVKDRGYDPNPNARTAYDGLMVGEGDHCVEDAKAIVEGAFPGFLPEHVLAALERT